MAYRIRGQKPRRRTFLKEYRLRTGLSQEAAATKFVELGAESMSGATISRLEKGTQPYTQDLLELAADVYGTDVLSLLSVDPTRPDPTERDKILPVWDQASEEQRAFIAEMATRLVKPGQQR